MILFDADNHYYEARDAFTRHLDRRLGERTVMEVSVGGRVRHLVGGRINHAVTNPTFDPISKPGALYGYFRGNPDGRTARECLADAEPIRPAYREPAARLTTMDAQQVGGTWLFPTLGVMYEEALKQDPQAVCLTFRSFNRWLDEDWGLNHGDRIFAAPYLSLADVDWAVEELTWALDHGARVVCLRPAAPTTAVGQRSPGDEMFDPFWGLADEAGITVAVHGGESGYSVNGYAPDGLHVFERGHSPIKQLLNEINIERPIMDFLAALVCDRVFERFTNLRVASIENGASYLATLFSRLRNLEGKLGDWFSQDPVEAFKRHIWISPFWEEDIGAVAELLGADRVLFGSDWPHVEGLPEPIDYLTEVAHLEPPAQERIVAENARALTALSPR